MWLIYAAFWLTIAAHNQLVPVSAQWFAWLNYADGYAVSFIVILLWRLVLWAVAKLP